MEGSEEYFDAMRSMGKAFRMYLLHPDDDLSCGGSARASARARARMRGEKTRERARERRESDESDNAVEGSEEYFDESEHVDGFAAEERSSDGEEVE